MRPEFQRVVEAVGEAHRHAQVASGGPRPLGPSPKPDPARRSASATGQPASAEPPSRPRRTCSWGRSPPPYVRSPTARAQGFPHPGRHLSAAPLGRRRARRRSARRGGGLGEARDPWHRAGGARHLSSSGSSSPRRPSALSGSRSPASPATCGSRTSYPCRSSSERRSRRGSCWAGSCWGCPLVRHPGLQRRGRAPATAGGGARAAPGDRGGGRRPRPRSRRARARRRTRPCCRSLAVALAERE